MNLNRALTFLFFSVILLFSAFFVNAQVAKIDSLENVLIKNIKDDTIKVNLLNQIAYLVYKTDTVKAHRYLTMASQLSDQLNYAKGKARSMYITGSSLVFHNSYQLSIKHYLDAAKLAEENNLKFNAIQYLLSAGFSYSAIGNISSAMEYYTKAKSMAEEIKSKSALVNCLLRISIIYTGQGDYESALENYQKIIELSKETGKKSGLAAALSNIGSINNYKGDYPKALEYFYKTLDLYEELNSETGILNCHLSIGSINTSMGNYDRALEYLTKALTRAEKLNYKRRISQCYEYIGELYSKTNHPQALEYLEKALTISEGLSYTTSMLNVSLKIGKHYLVRSNHEKALEYYQKALVLSEEMDRKRTICEIWYKTGSIHFSQKEYSKALFNTMNALEIANEMNLLSYQRDIHNQLSDIYAATNDYTKAYTNHKLYKKLNDSIYKKENLKKIIELEYTYKFEKEKQAIELEQQKKDAIQEARKKHQRVIIFWLTFSLILMSLLALYIYRLYKFKKQTNLLLKKQNIDIHELNEEQMVLNEQLKKSNEQLYKSKELIEERENLLTQITNNVPVYLSLLNNKLDYVFANSGYAEVFSKNKKRVTGQNIIDVVENKYLERASLHIEAALQGETVIYENYIHSSNNAMRYIQTTYVPYYFHNDIHGVLVCSADISQRKLAEQALREVELEKKQLMEAEIERINYELETNQKSITAATLKLIQNSERDADTINRLSAIEKNTNEEGRRSISSLISDYKRLSYNSNWDEFEILFEKVHSSFYENCCE